MRGTKLTPCACMGGGSGLGVQSWVQPAPALLIYSPSWWVVKLLLQLFPVKSPHQEARHLASLKKKYFSAGNCFLKTAQPPGRSCRGTDVCAGQAAEDAETVEPGRRWRHERIRGEVLRQHQQVLHSLSWAIPLLPDFSKEERLFLAYKRRNDYKWGM